MGLEIFCKKGVSLKYKWTELEIGTLILHRILIESGRIMIEYGQLTISWVTIFFWIWLFLFVGVIFSPLST